VKKPCVLIIVENLPVPLDRRVWQEALALKNAGWKVSVICPATERHPQTFEELNGIASAAPDMIRAMFAGNTASANLLALDEKSIVAQAQLESAILAASERGALSADETKELARLGELAKKTRDPVKEDIETLKSVLALPIVGGDAAVRLAPKSQQDAVIRNAEAAKRAVGALLAAIRKLP